LQKVKGPRGLQVSLVLADVALECRARREVTAASTHEQTLKEQFARKWKVISR
jgi:hypothetical protein